MSPSGIQPIFFSALLEGYGDWPVTADQPRIAAVTGAGAVVDLRPALSQAASARCKSAGSNDLARRACYGRLPQNVAFRPA
jgi:hypothetical protein